VGVCSKELSSLARGENIFDALDKVSESTLRGEGKSYSLTIGNRRIWQVFDHTFTWVAENLITIEVIIASDNGQEYKGAGEIGRLDCAAILIRSDQTKMLLWSKTSKELATDEIIVIVAAAGTRMGFTMADFARDWIAGGN